MSAPSAPRRNIIHVTWLNLDEIDDDELDELRETLSADDGVRAAKYATPLLRRRAVVRFARYRQIAADLLGVACERVTVDADSNGQRFANAIGSDERLAMSTSQCDGDALVALAWKRQVGVDVERISEVPASERFVAWTTTADEAREIASAKPENQPRAHARLWTRKEAYLKATGEGIGAGMRHIRAPVVSDAWALLHAPFEGATPWWWYALPCPRSDLEGTLVVSFVEGDGEPLVNVTNR